MGNSVFGELSFSDESNILFDEVLNERKVNRLVKRIRERHYHTYKHSIGVAKLMAEYVISDSSDLSKEKQKNMVRLALLHDIGKIGISNSILDKKSTLNNGEWHRIRNHPIDGYKKLAKVFDPQDMIPVLTHHSYQINDYPKLEEQEAIVDSCGLDKKVLANGEVVFYSIILSTIDHLEARFPLIDKDHPELVRRYSDRNYNVSDLMTMVRSSFNKSNRIKEVGKLDYFEDILDFSTKLFSKENNELSID